MNYWYLYQEILGQVLYRSHHFGIVTALGIIVGARDITPVQKACWRDRFGLVVGLE